MKVYGTVVGLTPLILLSVQTAIIRLNKTGDYRSWLRQSGTLPSDAITRIKLEDMIQRGLAEIETFLKAEKVQ